MVNWNKACRMFIGASGRHRFQSLIISGGDPDRQRYRDSEFITESFGTG
jgi:hypothetical protein